MADTPTPLPGQDPLTVACALDPGDSLVLTRSPMLAETHVALTQDGDMTSLFLDRDALLRVHCWIGAALNASIPGGPNFASSARYTLGTAKPTDSVVVAVVGVAGDLVTQTRCDRARDLARIAACLTNEVIERIGMGDAAGTALLIACTDAERAIREALGDG